MPPCAFGLSVVLLSLSGVMGAGPRDSPAPPLIHLRTGTINILETPARRGPPTSVGTVLVTVERPKDMDGVMASIEELGGHVDHYLPDSTLLCVCQEEVADAIAGLPGVAWVGDFVAEYKKSPGWDPLLKVIRQGGGKDMLQAILHGNGTKGLGHGLHVDNQGCVPVVVSFPPLPGASSSLRHVDLEGWKPSGGNTSAVDTTEPWLPLLESRRYDPAAAAVEEWPGTLRELFGEGLKLEATTHNRATVWAPLSLLPGVLDWVAEQPLVHWVAPRYKHHFKNYYATAITSNGRVPGSFPRPWNSETHPLWAAGLRGQGQVVGNGDSGIDLSSCFFSDPGVPLALKKNVFTQVNWFENPQHRKIRFYRLYADSSGSTGLPVVLDRGGHGTHVAGSLVGESLGEKSEFNGIASGAKIAFHDLGNEDAARGIQTPWDLQTGYFRWSYLYGARVHSDSWGSDDSGYDSLAWDVDAFSWNNPDFLAVFAAGNDGEEGEATVFSPATSKNGLTVGATLSADGYPLPRSDVKQLGSVYKASISGGLVGGWLSGDRFNVLQSMMGGALTSVLGKSFNLVAADPITACSDLINAASVNGKVVVVERGGCYDVDKLQAAQRAGATGVLVANNNAEGYFNLDAPNGRVPRDLVIPAAAIPKSVGHIILMSLTLLKPLQVRFDPNSQAPNKFDNIADYSSFGPTLDGRIKPDVVAPGTVASSASGSPCEVSVYRGTSMATPIVAGGALLVRQYFMEGYYPTGKPTEAHKHVPSGALVKAVIIGGATPLTGFTETGLPLAPTPSWRQGYGRVTLVKSLPLEGSAVGWRMQVVDGAKLATGESHQYCVRAAGGPMRITLVWHDLPSDVAAEKNLVNDLDLTVRAAGLQGMDLLGNGETDRLNNVEQVMLDEVTAGPVAINVMAHNVFAKFGPQPYSLVVHGVFNGALESSHNPASRDTSVSSSASCVVLVASITIGPDMITRSRDPEFTFNTRSGEVPVQGFECLLGRGDGEGAARGPDGTHTWRACESPTRYTGLRDGPYTFTVRARGEEVEDSHPFLIDTTAPTVAFYKRPPVITSSQMAEVQFTAEDTTSVRLECMLESLTGGGGQQVDNRNGRVELGEWTPCTSPQQLQHIGVGEWRFTVRAKDAVGNQAAPEKIEWLVELDRNKVYTRLLSGPAGLVNGKEVGFEFQALRALGEEEGVPQEQHRFQCILEERHGSLWESAEPFSKGWEACESPWRQSGIPDGEYRFSAMIQGGDLSKPETHAVTEFTIDSQPPEIAITVGPSPLQAGRTAKFAFESTEPAITFRCALLSGETIVRAEDWMSCTSPKVYTSLSDGVYTFYLTGLDEVGNSADSEKQVFQVDGSQPAIRNVSVPPPSNSTSSTAVFVVDDGTDGSGVDNVQCRLAAMCLGPADCDGGRVVATGQGGTTIGHDWQSCGHKVCRRCDDGTVATTGQFVPCLRCTVKYELEEGLFHFSVRAFDRALNSNNPTNFSLVVDSQVPQGAVRSGPTQEYPVASSVRFTFDLLDGGPGGSGVTQTLCMLQLEEGNSTQQTGEEPNFDGVGTRTSTESSLAATGNSFFLAETVNMVGTGETPLGQWTPCEEPVVYSELHAGRFKFFLMPIDGAGNQGLVSDPYSFEVDPTLPIPNFFKNDPPAAWRQQLPPASSATFPADTSASSAAPMATVIAISVAVALAAAGIIVLAILWSRRMHRCSQREAYTVRSPVSGASAPHPQRHDGRRGAAERAAQAVDRRTRMAAEDEVLRRAIQASIEDRQMETVIQASLQCADEDRARKAAQESAEQLRLEQGLSASVELQLAALGVSSPFQSRDAGPGRSADATPPSRV